MKSYEDKENFYIYSHRPEFTRLEFLEIYLFNMHLLFDERDESVRQTHRHILEAKKEALLEYEEAKATGKDYYTSREIEMHHEVEELTMNRLSLELFYPSFFISLYADFEKSLFKLCCELRSPNEILEVKDLSDKGIKRSKNYLVKILNIDKKFFGDNQDWQKIVSYGKLRNYLSHADKMPIPYTKNGVIEFYSEAEIESLSSDEILNTNWFDINKKNCFDAINVIGNFWVSLFHLLSKNFEI